jgi:tetratricopeptide (TPR) repeat protein
LLLAISPIVLYAATLQAALGAQCTGPSELQRDVEATQSAQAHSALGAWFAQHQQLSCAIEQFEKATKIAPNLFEAHYNLGLALIDNHESGRAIAVFRRAIALQPDSVRGRIALGTALQQSGQFGEARQQFETVLQADPKSAYALDHLAQIYFTEKRYVPAMTAWRNAASLAPSDPDIKVELGVALSKNGNNKEAIDVLKQVVGSAPGLAAGHFNLATVYANEKMFRESAEEYKATLNIEPDNDTARLALAKAYASIANYQDALLPAQEYVSRNPRVAEGHHVLGSVYRGLARYAEAEQELGQAVQMDLSDYGIRYELGFVLLHENKPEQALPHLQKALEIRPESAEARFQLANALKALNRTEEAKAEFQKFQAQKERGVSENIAAATGSGANKLLVEGDPNHAAERYREALKLDPNNAKTWFNLAIALDELGRKSEEQNALEKALALDPSLPQPHNQVGLIYASQGRVAEAEEHFKKAISLDPQYADAQTNLGVLYGRTGRNREAETLLRQATENNPHLLQAHLNLGLILANDNRLPEAAAEIEKAVEIDHQNPTALTAQGMIQSKLGKSDESVTTFKQLAKAHPESAEAQLNLGIALADSYRLEPALAQFEQAKKLAPNTAAPYFNLGRVLVDLHRYDEAISELQQAAQLAPSYPVPLYLLALAQTKLQGYQAAIETLKKFLAVQSRDADAYFLLGQSYQKLGRTEDAIAAWKQAIEIDPSQAEALYNLMRTLAKTNPSDARVYRERFETLQRQNQLKTEVETLANFALASAKRGDYAQAVTQLQEAIKQCGDCSSKADLHKDLGLIECKSGDVRSGESDLLLAKSLKPGDQDVLTALAIINKIRGQERLP